MYWVMRTINWLNKYNNKKNVLLLIKVLVLASVTSYEKTLSSAEIDIADYASVELNSTQHKNQAKELVGNIKKNELGLTARSQEETRILVYNLIRNEMPKATSRQVAALTRTVLLSSLYAKLDPIMLLALIKTESGFNPKAVGGVGEIGLMQIRPETAKWIAKSNGLHWRGKEALKDPHYNIRIGVEYLKHLRNNFGQDGKGYISAYNMGTRKVRQLYKKKVQPYVYSTKIVNTYITYHQATVNIVNSSSLITLSTAN